MTNRRTSCVHRVSVLALWSLLCLYPSPVTGQRCSCRENDRCKGGTHVCGPDGSCNIENVAYGKLADLTSVGAPGHVACLAVNGDTSTLFDSGNSKNCAESYGEDHSPKWSVDLGQNYTISNITVYKRTDGEDASGPRRMSDVVLKVDDQLCHSFPTHDDMTAVDALPAKIDIQCDPPLTGRTVKLEKVNPQIDDNYYFLINICEVQVWGCAAGYYGDCNSQCGRCAASTTCSPVTGHCPAGCVEKWKPPSCQECLDGYFGPQCSTCGYCKDNVTCNTVSGECPEGCQAGYNGSHCNETCREGSYGPDCSSECGRCIEGSTCNRETGECPTGCQSGWRGSHCVERCERGTYGPGCNSLCGQCLGGSTCDTVTGACPQGCQNGWQGPHCNQTCGSGFYGAGCVSACGQCKGNSTCNADNGECEQGCETGFVEPKCALMANSESSAGDTDNLPTIVGAVVGCLVLLAIVIIIIVFLMRRKRDSGKRPSSHNLTDNTGPAKTENVIFHNPLSFSPLTGTDHSGNTTGKPTAAVTPTVIKPSTVDTSRTGHIYMNQDDAAAPSQSRQRTPENRLPAASSEESRTVLAASCTTSQAAAKSTSGEPLAVRTKTPDPCELDDDAASMDGLNVYQNEDEVYASFKASRPELDNVQRYLVDRLASGELPYIFADLTTGSEYPRNVSNLDVNYKKNRFASIQPYDSNRVVLCDGYHRHGATDFVNASYISGYTSKKAYIAAQGPRENTVGDFWRMVWQEKTTHIVMLTNVIEAAKNKCHEYWPASSRRQTYGPITVTGDGEEHRANFVIRNFKIKCSGGREEREVVQYHYVSWPDHGAPDPTSLIVFWRFVTARTAHNPNVPLLVHCSAGVGRTGTFIGLDIGFQSAVHEGQVDVVKLVNRMREERCWMVQAAPAGEFVNTFPQPVNVFSPHSHIGKEFKTLIQMQALTPKQTCDFAMEDDNITKNRKSDVLPADNHLVYLMEDIQGRNQYINAVYVSSFWHQRGIILTQLPLPNTLVDFWRMVYGDGVQTIVSLASRGEEQELMPYCWYWPRAEGETTGTGPYTVQFQSKSQTQGGTTSYMLKLEKEGEATSRDVRVLRYENWTGEVPASTTDLHLLVDALDKGRTDSVGPPVIVQCSDGVSRSGLFSAACDVIHRMKYDAETDIYMTVRRVQTVRPQAVMSEVQYRCLYDLAQRQAGEMAVYANA